MKSKVKSGVVFLIFGFLFGAFEFYLFLTDEYKQMKQAEMTSQEKVTALQQEVTRLEGFAKNIETVKREFSELNVQLEAALEHMPRNFNLAALLRKLSLVAQNSSVEVSVFKPKLEEVKKAGKDFYESVDIDFTVSGSFTQTLAFLDQMARLKRIVNVEGIRMAPLKLKDGPFRNQLMVKSDLTVRTYRLQD